MSKSAEALREEAHAMCACICTDKATGNDLKADHGCGDGRCDLSCCKGNHRAIDLYAAARAAEVGEGMHVAMCWCHPFMDDGFGDCCLDCPRDTPAEKHPYTDPRCAEARERLRAEVERLSK